MNELHELRERLVESNDVLLRLARERNPESADRIHAKAEGVRLAISYLDEYLRTSEALYAEYGK